MELNDFQKKVENNNDDKIVGVSFYLDIVRLCIKKDFDKVSQILDINKDKKMNLNRTINGKRIIDYIIETTNLEIIEKALDLNEYSWNEKDLEKINTSNLSSNKSSFTNISDINYNNIEKKTIIETMKIDDTIKEKEKKETKIEDRKIMSCFFCCLK